MLTINIDKVNRGGGGDGGKVKPVKPNQTLCYKAILNRPYDNVIHVLCISKPVHQHIQNLTTLSSQPPSCQRQSFLPVITVSIYQYLCSLPHISICTVHWMGGCSIELLKPKTPDSVQHWRSNRYTKRPIITLPKWQDDIFQSESTCTPMLWISFWKWNRTSVNESVLYVACLL